MKKELSGVTNCLLRYDMSAKTITTLKMLIEYRRVPVRFVQVINARQFKNVVFFEATTPEDRMRGSRLSKPLFGKSLSEESYLEREDYLANLPLPALADNPEHVLAMCKTLHRDLLIRDGAGLREEQGFCVRSVITDSRYRGRGLATALMRNLAEWLDGPGGAAASIMFSEFYARTGWDIFDAFQSTLTVSPSLPCGEQRAKLLETLLLTTNRRRPPEPVRPRRGESEGRLPEMAISPETTLLTVLPTTKMYYDLHHQKLTIQRAKPPKNQSDEVITQVLAQLFLDALEEAVKCEVQNVRIWNPGLETYRAMGFVTEEVGIEILNEKLEVADVPCLRWRGGEKRPMTIVQSNEFYSWC
ncbi:hypothetical protein F5Y06DRAFT_290161 [Hypoxylon sp. FL0890]|nr:hypothetical protein F5Y06DRAFT_290161 [Hypoxylon sp. FL0890]